MTERTHHQLLMHRPHLHAIPPRIALPEGYTLRLYRDAADLPHLAEVLSRSFETEWTTERVEKALTGAPDVKAVYLAAWNDIPVATASSRELAERFPGSGYVHWVGSHPAHQGKGLGYALMVRVLHDFRERGWQAAVLETDDFRIPAIRTYLKTGFVPEYDNRGEDHRARWSAVLQAAFSSRSGS